MQRFGAESGSYDPDTLNLLGRAFDEVWEAMARNYGSPQAADAARQQLATIILGLAPRDGVLDFELVKYSALVAMRRETAASESSDLA